MTENQIQPIQNTTLIPTINSDLSELSLDKLASIYDEIDQRTHIYKGTILLEARKRFPSNIEFGKWCDSVQTLCLDGQRNRNKYMNLAAFFHDKDMEGIQLTACYAISRPENAEVADAVYEKASNQNLSVTAVNELIQEEKVARGIQKDSSIVKNIPDSEMTSLEMITSLDKGELNFMKDVQFFLLKNKILARDLLHILLEYQDCSSKTKPSVMRLYNIVELVEDEVDVPIPTYSRKK